MSNSHPTITISELVEAIHAAPGQIVLVVTGGGSGAISALLEVPGASRTVLEATVPYAPQALAAWLGAKPEQSCSDRTARAMAMAAYERACRYAGSSPSVPLAGVACTASLASDRPKHGDHRIHIALQTAADTWSWATTLQKGRRSRGEEEQLAARMVLNCVARFLELEPRLPIEWRDEATVEQHGHATSDRQQLLAGTVATAASQSSPPPPRAILPGAFDPLHTGHRAMAALGARRLGSKVDYELSIANVDKPPLDFIEMDRRAGQFADDETLWFTRAPTFAEKAAIFPGVTFLVGADTIERIGQPRYYGDDAQRAERALDTIAAHGCRFLVFGRVKGARFTTLADLELPAKLAALCDEVPASEFRNDISSTELRKRAANERE
ncbi:MAG TPA: CinA family protein [Pirellulales bacterium]|nr:CinA family protein [Pirellulales bacterium]